MSSERFGNYEILRKIAAGGMAEVFLAKQTGIGGFERLVCIKRILPHLGEQEDFINMFQDEARIAANLVHPNIAQIYDIGRVQGSYYIAMEYVRGEDLRRIYNQEVARGRAMPLEPAAQVIMGAAAGLDIAHRQTSIDGRPLGIVHRDVSPQNILVTYDGHVKIVDFGVAKASGKLAETRIGVLKGKYSYMSPEQAAGDPIDARTDIFALGITLYEVTTGVRLFKRETELETLHAVIDCKVTKPSEIVPKYDREFEAILMKALAHDPDDRYQTAGDLREALEKFLVKRGQATGASSLGPYMQDLFAEKLADDMLLGPATRPSSFTPNGKKKKKDKDKDKDSKSGSRPKDDWGSSPRSRSTEASTRAEEVSVSASELQEETSVSERHAAALAASKAAKSASSRPSKSSRASLAGEETVMEGSGQKSRGAKSTSKSKSDGSGAWGNEASIAIDSQSGEIPGWEASESKPRESTNSAVARALQREADSDWGQSEGSLSESQTATQAVPELVVQQQPAAAEGMVEVKHDQLAEARAIPEPPATPWLPRIAMVVLVFGIAAAIVLVYASHRRSPGELPRSGPLAIDSEPRGARIIFYGLGADMLNARYDGARTPFTVSEGIPVEAMLEAEFVKDGYVIVKQTLPKVEEEVVPEPLFAELTAEAGTEKATLVIMTTPPGAELWVDGEKRGTTPVTDVRVDGSMQHKVELKLAGHTTRTDQLYVEPGERRFFEATLEKVAAAGALSPAPTAPPPLVAPKAGASPAPLPRSEARTPDKSDRPALVNKPSPTLSRETRDEDEVDGLKAPKVAGKGYVSIDSSVPLKVYIGERLLGDTPLKRVALDVGEQKVRLVNDREGISMTRKIRVGNGSIENIDIKLRRGSLAVNATPWAWVRIGSRQPVETPLRLDVYEGDYTVRFECPDGKQMKDTAHVVAGKTATLSASCR
ncbi:MAG TPA: serine/threonine-protein kinase [Myxococcota bacterium]|nr:serine/threonine-protein kinase [Myxococcota bacterium]